MEERSEIESFNTETKMVYSYRSDMTSSIIIPIKCESRSPSPKSRYDASTEGVLINVSTEGGSFDPTTGLFKIPGIDLNLINAYSATVFQEEEKVLPQEICREQSS